MTHRGSVKDGGAIELLGGAETSRRATAPRRQQPPHGVGKRWRQFASLTRQSPSTLARFLAKKGKHVRKEHFRREVGLPRARKCNKRGTVVLTLGELRHITNNFSHDQLIGEGAFGKVYKGVLTNGDVIAVKRFASTITGLQDAEYQNEAQHLMGLKHPNIVKLKGCCSQTVMKLIRHNGIYVRAEQRERLLCLEYMPKGSLRLHLSDETAGLEWNTRYKIIEGICNGLSYLHEGWEPTPIIHMDLKPANILLDDNMLPKIADFGLSRLFGEEQTRTCTTRRNGTLGYMPPEYLDKGVITKKFDIFSLGVIIIEIITGHKDYPTAETETASQQYIDLVLNNWKHRLPKVQGDTSQDIDYQQIKECIQIALLCVKYDSVKRPTINQIMEMLKRSDEAYRNERKDEKLQDVLDHLQKDFKGGVSAENLGSVRRRQEDAGIRVAAAAPAQQQPHGGLGMDDDTELKEGKAYGDDDAVVDLDAALSYIDKKVQDVLGHFQEDFVRGVSAENLGSKFGGYGSFLPTYQRSPLPQTRSPPKGMAQKPPSVAVLSTPQSNGPMVPFSGDSIIKEIRPTRETERREACRDDTAFVDPDIALSYIDKKLQDVLGHFQQDFEGGVSAENLGSKFGGYGSFLPTYQPALSSSSN